MTTFLRHAAYLIEACNIKLPQKVEELKEDRYLPPGPPTRESAAKWKGWRTIYDKPNRWRRVPRSRSPLAVVVERVIEPSRSPQPSVW